MSSPTRARFQLAGAAVLFSTGGAAIKAADFVGWQITCLRSGIAAVAIWLIAGEARRGWTWRGFPGGGGYPAAPPPFRLGHPPPPPPKTVFLPSTPPPHPALLPP